MPNSFLFLPADPRRSEHPSVNSCRLVYLYILFLCQIVLGYFRDDQLSVDMCMTDNPAIHAA